MQVIKAFNFTVKNSYRTEERGKKGRLGVNVRKKLPEEYGKIVAANGINSEEEDFEDHFEETASSRFVLCPSGLGMDSYRLWETLLLGSIPIVESNPGLDRTYSFLPVLVVSNYSYLSPQLLRAAYPCFIEHAHEFKYKHLTSMYWQILIRRAVDSASIDHVERNHPFKNIYCDFLHWGSMGIT